MKIKILIYLLAGVFPLFAAGTGNDSAYVKQILLKQIEAARTKSVSPEISTEIIKPKAGKVVKKSSSVITSLKISKKEIKREKVDNNSQLFNIFLLFEAALAATIFIVYRRRVAGFSKLDKKELKKNIRSLRDEKIKYSANPELSRLRRTLSNLNVNWKNGSKTITAVAKKFNIGKGEVHLAAKINLLMDKQ